MLDFDRPYLVNLTVNRRCRCVLTRLFFSRLHPVNPARRGGSDWPPFLRRAEDETRLTLRVQKSKRVVDAGSLTGASKF